MIQQLRRTLLQQQSSKAFSQSKALLSAVSLNETTEVVKVGENLYKGHVADGWNVGDAPNGGYMMMMAINAASAVSKHPHPLNFNATYIAKASENVEAEFNVRLVSTTRSSTMIHVTMSQAGELKSEYNGIFGDLNAFEGTSMNQRPPVIIPPRPDCFDGGILMRKIMGDKLKLSANLELKVAHDSPFATGLYAGKLGKEAKVTTYMATTALENISLSSLAFFNDAIIPPVCNMVKTNWVPTLQFSVQFWSEPPKGAKWVIGRFETTFVKNSVLFTDGEIWSEDGQQLLSTSRQLARVLVPRDKK